MMFKEDTIRRLPGRRVGLVLLAMALAASLTLAPAAKPAQAAFPGKNGKIAFQSDRGGNTEIYTMTPNGSNQTRSPPLRRRGLRCRSSGSSTWAACQP
jgi:hypothetical protein